MRIINRYYFNTIFIVILFFFYIFYFVYQIFDQVPSDLCPGKSVFWQGGIVGIAYRNQPRKLGKVLLLILSNKMT